MSKRNVLILLTPILFAGAVPARSATPSVDGVFLAGDFGQILQLHADTLREYEITAASCIELGTAKRRPGRVSGQIVFVGKPLGARRISVDKEGTLWLHSAGIHQAELQRLPGLPDRCGSIADTPLSNYEVFWRTFSERYPFFAERKMDWAGVDRQFRPQVTGATSPADLFGILQQMIGPLQDARTAINAPSIRQRFDGAGRKPGPQNGAIAERRDELLRKKYVRGELRSYCHVLGLGPKPSSGALMHFALLNDSIGYLRVDAIVRGCERDLDRIFRAAAELKGLVIDARLGWDGGGDPSGQAIELASRLANEEYAAYVTIHGARRRPETVRPNSRPGFGGHVVLLTGPESGSAAELFALASFGRVTRVGGATRGAYSDVMQRRLPNGWSFSLPAGSYVAADGRTYDFTGIPPDILVPPFSGDDLDKGRDTALETAVQELKKSR